MSTWPDQCPDMWSNIILDVPVSVFLDEINIWIGGLWTKQIIPHNVCGGVQIAEGLDKTKDWLPLSKRELCKRQPSDMNCNFCLSLDLLPTGPPWRFWTCQTPKSCELIIYIQTISQPIYQSTSLVGSVSLEKPIQLPPPI